LIQIGLTVQDAARGESERVVGRIHGKDHLSRGQRLQPPAQLRLGELRRKIDIQPRACEELTRVEIDLLQRSHVRDGADPQVDVMPAHRMSYVREARFVTHRSRL